MNTELFEKRNAFVVVLGNFIILLLVGGLIVSNAPIAYADRFTSLIQYYAYRNDVPWEIMTAQMLAESSANTKAKSPVGAMGLLQFMPRTWEEWKGHPEADPWNPEDSIEAATRYMRHLFDCYSEIPDVNERWKFALAAYNAGRANINKALEKARTINKQPAKYSDWKQAGSPPGTWQYWDYTKNSLRDVTGPNNAKETINYLTRIITDSALLGYEWNIFGF